MRVIITRPASDASTWVNALYEAGHEASALPLIDVGAAADPEPVLQAWTRWSEWQAVMFVSAQAVRFFFASRLPAQAFLEGPRCWATGPGTHKALLQAGVPETCIDSPSELASQFDSEALWQRVSFQVHAGGRPVLIVRGVDVATNADLSSTGTGRDWLAQQLRGLGVAVDFVVAYERRMPKWTDRQIALAHQAATDGSVWCFSSSQALAHLSQALPDQNWAPVSCLVTHRRIAQSAEALGFVSIRVIKPLLADLLASLESLA